MFILADLIRAGGASVIERAPGMVLLIENPSNKQKSRTQSGNTKRFVCWTCGKDFEAADFLWHIRECCK